MHVTPNGISEYSGGNEIGRYGRRHGDNAAVLVWYHRGLYEYDCAAWAMEPSVEWAISVSVDTLYAVDDGVLYAIERDGLTAAERDVDGSQQYVATERDDFVHEVGDPAEHLRGNLWITPESAHDGYHKQQNEA